MKPTTQGTDFRPPRHHHYPSMTGKERLVALRSIRGMLEGQGARDHKAHRGRPGRPQNFRCGRLSPVYVLDTNATIHYTDDEPAAVAALEPLLFARRSESV
jgi:hypothetical protein